MATEVLRPNAAGRVTLIPTQYPNADYHWDKVDEGVSDDDSTYVENTTDTVQVDCYGLTNPTGSGTINKVTAYARTKSDDPGLTDNRVYVGIGNGSSEKASGVFYPAITYTLYSYEWATNPWTLANWSWDDLTNLEGVVRLCAKVGGHYSRCTQVYVEVDYTPPPAAVTALNIGDTFKAIDWTGSKINVGDAWKATRTVKVNIADAWKRVYSSPAVLNEDATYILLESGTDDRIEVE
jgi:hypothetical protein